MLIHFTRKIEALDSILCNGFLYLHNETEVLGPVAQEALGINADSQSNGMICFTELPQSNLSGHQNDFGRFGVGVSKDWLIQKNAQKVVYVPVGSEVYKTMVTTMKSLAPKTLSGKRTDELLACQETRYSAIRDLTNIKFAKLAGASLEYLDFLESFEWMQTEAHVAEMEWRIRNPKPYRFSGQPNRQQQIELLVNCVSDPNIQDNCEGMQKYTVDCRVELILTGKLSLVLPLPKEQIRAIFCSEDNALLIRDAFLNAGLGHIPIITSPD